MSTAAASTFFPALTRAPTPASSLEALRAQAAFVRALLDDVERLTPLSIDGEALCEQLAEEICRLASRSLQAAAELRRHADAHAA